MCYKIISGNTTGPLRQTTVRTSTQDRQKNSNKARHWCEKRAFTPVELHDKLEEMSGKNLGISQIRRYAREWGYSRKKTQPIMVNRTPIEEVNKWRASLYQKIARYTKM